MEIHQLTCKSLKEQKFNLWYNQLHLTLQSHGGQTINSVSGDTIIESMLIS